MSRFFKYALLGYALLYFIIYCILVFYRIQYPFELEWMEGGSVDHVRRILSGQKLYVSPSLEFVPFGYTPLYFYISAVISKLLGIGFSPLRLLSFISSLGCFFIIFLMVRRETRSTFSAILASSLFVATFRISGAWFDIARVDSLFLFFILAALYIVRFNDSSRSYILAGLFISLSFLTKQTALIIFLPIMLYCIVINRRPSISLIITMVVIVGGSTLLLNHIHDGWYSYYIFLLSKQRPINVSRFFYFWSKDIFLSLSIPSFGIIFYLSAQMRSLDKRRFFFYVSALIGMLGGSLISRLQFGGYHNVLFPAYAIMAILFGLAIHTAAELIQRAPENKRRILEIYLYLICIIQFTGLAYNPFTQIPTREDLKAGKEFIRTMAELQGDILLPSHGYLPVLAGKKSHAHAMAIVDFLWGENTPEKARFIEEIRKKIREKKFSAIILDSPWFPEEVSNYYIKQRALFDSPAVFWPVTGEKTRPEWIYISKTNIAN